MTSTINPQIPASGALAKSSDIRQQFQAAINDINTLSGQLPGGGGNFSNAVVAPASTPTAVRTMAARAADVANVQDYIAISSNVGAAAIAAFASLPTTGGEVYFPAGTYTLSSSLLMSGKAITVTGAGIGVTTLIIAHNGFGIDIAPSAVTQYVVIRDLSIVAGGTTQSAGAVRVVSTAVGSWPLSTLIMQNVAISGTFNSSGAGTFAIGVSLKNCWQPQLINVSGTGTGLSGGGAVTGTSMIQLDNIVGLVATNLVAYYWDNAINQISYCEGVNLMAPQIVACNLAYQQTGITLSVANLTLNGLWITGGEINCYSGVLNISQSTTCFVSGTDMNRYGNSGTTWTVFKLIDAGHWIVGGVKINGGSTTSQVFALTASGGAGSSGALNHFFGMVATNCQVASTLGTGTAYNKISGFISLLVSGPTQAVTDAGSFNDVQWEAFNGVANANNWQFMGRQGQALLGLASVDNAVNAPWFFPSVAGDANGVQLKIIGTDTNIPFKILTQGTAGFQVAGANGIMFVAAQPGGTVANFLQLFSSATGTAPKIQAAGSDTNIGISILGKGANGVVLGNDNGTLASHAQGAGSTQVNYVQTISAAAGAGVSVAAKGSDTNVGLSLLAQGQNGVVLGNTNGTVGVFAQGAGTTQVNYWQFVSAQAGSGLLMQAAGTDTNVGMTFSGRGNAGVSFGNGNGTIVVLAQGTGTTQANYVQFVSAATGNAVQIKAAGSDTNVALQLAGQGTGGIFLNPVRVNMPNLPTSASGLSAGDLWKDTANSNVIKAV